MIKKLNKIKLVYFKLLIHLIDISLKPNITIMFYHKKLEKWKC